MKRTVLLILSVLLVLSLISCESQEKIKADFTVYCFNAGAADSFLIRTKNSAVLIDTAESSFGDEITDYLSSQGIDRLDYLIITHFDKDHVGGAAKVLKSVSVENVLQSNYTKDTSKKYENYVSALSYARIEAVTVREELKFSLDGAEFTVNPPEQEVYEKSASNNSSLIVSVRYGERKFLFCGDAEKDRLSEFIGMNTEKYDFVKIPHHGRWNSKIPELLSSVYPEYAVITSSTTEPEDKKTVDALESFGTEIFYTKNAPVRVVCDGTHIAVEYAE